MQAHLVHIEDCLTLLHLLCGRRFHLVWLWNNVSFMPTFLMYLAKCSMLPVRISASQSEVCTNKDRDAPGLPGKV
jgi:hypothetical protein